MDASSTCGSVSSRVVNVVYFLTRDGRLQQPHLLQIHRLHAHCLHLRDVKKSLSELRGKHLPDAFSWSFKRLYRGGYIWQDVVGDDLILPLSDDEYVLKGSELSNKYVSSSAETVSSGDEQEPKAAATSVKVKAPPPESESAKEKVVVKIDASMLEERRRKEIAKLQVEKQKPAASSSPWRRVRSLLDVLRCKTTATKDEALQPVLKARRNQQSNRSRCGPNVGDDTAGDNWQPSCRRKGSSPCKAGDAAVFKQSVAMPTIRSDCRRSFKPQHLDSHSKSSSVLHGRNKRGYKKMPTN